MFVRVLGIDPGLSRCGYGVVDERDGTTCAVAAGVIRTDPGAPVPQRLGELADELQALIDEQRPDAVAVERVLFQVNARTAMAVGQASGLALATAARAGIPVVEYSPNEVKMAVAGYGSAPKPQVQAMVQSLLKLADPPEPPDVADALALCLCHLAAASLRTRVGDAVARHPATTSTAGSGLEQAIAAAIAKEASR